MSNKSSLSCAWQVVIPSSFQLVAGYALTGSSFVPTEQPNVLKPLSQVKDSGGKVWILGYFYATQRNPITGVSSPMLQAMWQQLGKPQTAAYQYAGNPVYITNSSPPPSQANYAGNPAANICITPSVVAASIPVGTVLMFAGEFDVSTVASLFNQGWLPCTGNSYQYITIEPQYYPLFEVIGLSYGGDEFNFRVPDYRGLFVRGVSGTSGRDPDAQSRLPAQPYDPISPGGNSGNKVGSIQLSQFKSHTHNYHNFTREHKEDNIAIASHQCLKPGSHTFEMSAYGGSESRPVNQYVNYIIKYTDQINIIPVGAVLPYSGDPGQAVKLVGQNWLTCTGSQVSTATYAALHNVIKYSYGGNVTQKTFFLPDYRGTFMRAVQGYDPLKKSAVYDADAASRTAPWPQTGMTITGNKGDKVGSVQQGQLASHKHNYVMSADSKHTASTLIGFHGQASDLGATTMTSGPQPQKGDSSGSGAETRPVNMYVNYIIKC
jgi:microcystin-dependent protein